MGRTLHKRAIFSVTCDGPKHKEKFEIDMGPAAELSYSYGSVKHDMEEDKTFCSDECLVDWVKQNG